MREAVDMMAFVDAVYLLSGVVTLAVTVWSWRTMARAERRRDETRGK
jgi:hypothetical protein